LGFRDPASKPFPGGGFLKTGNERRYFFETSLFEAVVLASAFFLAAGFVSAVIEAAILS